MLDIVKVKKWYKQDLWTKNMLIDAVNSNNITAEQYKEITGEEFEAVEPRGE